MLIHYKGLNIGHSKVSTLPRKGKGRAFIKGIYAYFLGKKYKKLSKRIDKVVKKFNKIKGE